MTRPNSADRSPPRGPEETPTRSNGGAPDPRRYWRANLALIAALLGIWAAVSYGCGILLAEPLNRISIGSVPLGFWFAQQGSIYVFVALILVYAFMMDRLDRRYRFGEPPAGRNRPQRASQRTPDPDPTDRPERRAHPDDPAAPDDTGREPGP